MLCCALFVMHRINTQFVKLWSWFYRDIKITGGVFKGARGEKESRHLLLRSMNAAGIFVAVVLFMY